jgi:hypothetical protein
LIIAALAGEGKAAEAVDVFALDFLLQHPSLLRSYLRGTKLRLPPDAVPSPTETESSEEVLLRWKRSVGGRTLAPMIGRLIACGLVRRRPGGSFELAPRGDQAAEQLRGSTGVIERERLPKLAAQVAANPPVARQSLLAALAEETN